MVCKNKIEKRSVTIDTFRPAPINLFISSFEIAEFLILHTALHYHKSVLNVLRTNVGADDTSSEVIQNLIALNKKHSTFLVFFFGVESFLICRNTFGEGVDYFVVSVKDICIQYWSASNGFTLISERQH